MVRPTNKLKNTFKLQKKAMLNDDYLLKSLLLEGEIFANQE